jgi:hypothetical protein
VITWSECGKSNSGSLTHESRATMWWLAVIVEVFRMFCVEVVETDKDQLHAFHDKSIPRPMSSEERPGGEVTTRAYRNHNTWTWSFGLSTYVLKSALSFGCKCKYRWRLEH